MRIGVSSMGWPSKAEDEGDRHDSDAHMNGTPSELCATAATPALPVRPRGRPRAPIARRIRSFLRLPSVGDLKEVISQLERENSRLRAESARQQDEISALKKDLHIRARAITRLEAEKKRLSQQPQRQPEVNPPRPASHDGRKVGVWRQGEGKKGGRQSPQQ